AAQCNDDELLLIAYCGSARNAATFPTERSASCRNRNAANNPLVTACIKALSPESSRVENFQTKKLPRIDPRQRGDARHSGAVPSSLSIARLRPFYPIGSGICAETTAFFLPHPRSERRHRNVIRAIVNIDLRMVAASRQVTNSVRTPKLRMLPYGL